MYTEKRHAKNLLILLENAVKPCSLCPVDYADRYPNSFVRRDKYCPVCLKFVGGSHDGSCPCIILGKSEAVKRTWLALEEKGYI